jgi:hypothetical protein
MDISGKVCSRSDPRNRSAVRAVPRTALTTHSEKLRDAAAATQQISQIRARHASLLEQKLEHIPR